MTAEPGGGGAAPQPTPAASGGPPPLTAADLPAELAAQLPDDFVLPPGFAFIQIPEVTPEDQAAGNVEHAEMLRRVYEAALDDLDTLREHAAGQVAAQEAGVAATRDAWLAAEEHAESHASEHGIELPARLADPGEGRM